MSPVVLAPGHKFRNGAAVGAAGVRIEDIRREDPPGCCDKCRHHICAGFVDDPGAVDYGGSCSVIGAASKTLRRRPGGRGTNRGHVASMLGLSYVDRGAETAPRGRNPAQARPQDVGRISSTIEVNKSTRPRKRAANPSSASRVTSSIMPTPSLAVIGNRSRPPGMSASLLAGVGAADHRVRGAGDRLLHPGPARGGCHRAGLGDGVSGQARRSSARPWSAGCHDAGDRENFETSSMPRVRVSDAIRQRFNAIILLVDLPSASNKGCHSGTRPNLGKEKHDCRKTAT